MTSQPKGHPDNAAGGGLEKIDHVVVLMMENRSFDNILGYLYRGKVPAKAPLGKTIDGLLYPSGAAKPLYNPIPGDAKYKPLHGLQIVKAGPVPPGVYNQPYPDPGEDYPHINTQLFNLIQGGDQAPYNLPPGDPRPEMMGYIKDYIENFKYVESRHGDPNAPPRDPTYDEYRQIMQCYTPEHLPVTSMLATEFAVFDHWFCAVPSQTFCNRAFWHAGTSWGRLTNDPYTAWTPGSDAPTVFNQMSACFAQSGLDWRVYSGNHTYFDLTSYIHAKALEPYAKTDHFQDMAGFFADCAGGTLPAYSFIEPRIYNPHNDMHPSSTWGQFDGNNPPSSMTMGELLIWQVYEAIRTTQATSGSTAENTLLIITFDEAGGCYDHVAPPLAVPPDLGSNPPQDQFDYRRLGMRVPTIMVSAHIARNTVVNTPMDHCSFMNTMRRRWEQAAPGKFPPLTARVAAAPDFSEVFTAGEPRPASTWPKIPRPDVPDLADLPPPPAAPPNDLQRTCAAAGRHLADQGHPAMAGRTPLPT